MKRLINVGLFLALGGSMYAREAPPWIYYQEATTTKRGGDAPEAEVARPVVGIPDTGAQRQRRQQQQELKRTRALEELLGRRLAKDQEEKKNEPGSAPSQQESQAPPDQAPPPSQTEKQGVKASGQGMRLALVDAPIDRLVNTVMQELGYSYIIDPQVTGTVNIFTADEIPRNRLFSVLEQLLKMNGNAIVHQDDMYVIVPIGQSPTVPHKILMKPNPPAQEKATERSGPEQTEAERLSGEAEPEGQSPPTEEQSPQQNPQSGQPQPQPPASSQQGFPQASVPAAGELEESAEAAQLEGEQGVITYIIPLSYVPSSNMLQMAQAFISPGATVVDFQSANMLIITDYRKNIQQVLNLVNLLDTKYFDTNIIELVPIRFHNAGDVAEDLGKIFAPGDTSAGVRIVAIERLNSVLVVTNSTESFQEVAHWITRLDSPGTTTNIKTFIYQVENNTATTIAQVLAELFQDGSGLPSAATGDSQADRAAGVLAGGQRAGDQQRGVPTQEPGFVQGGGLNQQGRRLGGVGALQGGGGGGSLLGPNLRSRPNAGRSEIRSVVAGNVKIVVNEFNNSLIIQGTEADYQFLLDTIRQLDTLPRQVLIEAKMYAVELRDDLSFGVAAFLQERGTVTGEGQTQGPATTASIASGTGQLTAATRTIVGEERELQAIITALRGKTDVEMVDAPRLLALDGVQAQINIGAEVPVTSASFGDPLTSGDTSFINSIQFRPTGTTLLIVPRISASGIVTMDLAIEVSSVTGQAGSLTPTINRNFVETSMLVMDGQTIAIAGLISDSHSFTRSRVPLLGDIPIVGALFGQTDRDKRRTELLFMITPHVIRSVPTAAELTLDFKRALKNAYDYVNDMTEEEKELIRKRREQELRIRERTQPQ